MVRQIRFPPLDIPQPRHAAHHGHPPCQRQAATHKPKCPPQNRFRSLNHYPETKRKKQQATKQCQHNAQRFKIPEWMCHFTSLVWLDSESEQKCTLAHRHCHCETGHFRGRENLHARSCSPSPRRHIPDSRTAGFAGFDISRSPTAACVMQVHLAAYDDVTAQLGLPSFRSNWDHPINAHSASRRATSPVKTLPPPWTQRRSSCVAFGQSRD
jgi:hypothetical protein